jgi:hypothetical protein
MLRLRAPTNCKINIFRLFLEWKGLEIQMSTEEETRACALSHLIPLNVTVTETYQTSEIQLPSMFYHASRGAVSVECLLQTRLQTNLVETVTASELCPGAADNL